MTVSREAMASTVAAAGLDYDAIIIGAGMSGLYQLYRLRELGHARARVRGRHRRRRHLVLEPLSRRALRFRKLFLQLLVLAGAAGRSGTGPSISPPQPETLRYLNHVADKFDLRRDIQFRSRVTAAHYRDERREAGT